MTTALDKVSSHPAVNNSHCDTKCYVAGSSATLDYTTANSDERPSHCSRIACYSQPPSYRLQEQFLQG
jgi:hypothetical protein